MRHQDHIDMAVHTNSVCMGCYVDANKGGDFSLTERTQILRSAITVMQYKREKREQIPPDHKSANARDNDHMGLCRFLKKRTRADPRTLFGDRGRRQRGPFGFIFLSALFTSGSSELFLAPS